MENRESCTTTAEWTIWNGTDPNNCTSSCSAHLSGMLGDGENRVYPADGNYLDQNCCYIKQ